MSSVHTIRITNHNRSAEPPRTVAQDPGAAASVSDRLTKLVPQLPAILGDYRPVELLGRGGMGIVFRADDMRLGRQVAIKMLATGNPLSDEHRTRFLREARAQAAIEHDNVVSIFHVGENGDQPYLVMPLLKGISLHKYLQANPKPPLEEVIRIGREVAEGLAAAHAIGLIHRDIKPGNVWLEVPSGRVKILDFGLARDISNERATDEPLTMDGVIVGTCEYMSPEQARGESLDGRSDLFSLGVMLYQMTTGKRPFTSSDPRSVIARLLSSTPPSPRQVNPQIPESLSRLIDSLLAKQPDERPPTARAVADRLASFSSAPLNETAPQSNDPVSALTTGRRIVSSRWRAAILIAVVVSVLAAFVSAVSIGVTVALNQGFLPRIGIGRSAGPEWTMANDLMRDFQTVTVKDGNGIRILLHPGAPPPPGPIQILALDEALPTGLGAFRRMIENGPPPELAMLREINLTAVELRSEDVAGIAERLPRCRIQWSGGVVEPTQRD